MQYELDYTSKVPPSVQEQIREGMAQAEQNACQEWKTVITGCILAVARKLPELTVDDVLSEIESIPESQRPSTHNLSALGPMMRNAAKDGLISRTGKFLRSEREIKRGNLHAVWASNYFRKAN
jgi:hypothetical protein